MECLSGDLDFFRVAVVGSRDHDADGFHIELIIVHVRIRCGDVDGSTARSEQRAVIQICRGGVFVFHCHIVVQIDDRLDVDRAGWVGDYAIDCAVCIEGRTIGQRVSRHRHGLTVDDCRGVRDFSIEVDEVGSVELAEFPQADVVVFVPVNGDVGTVARRETFHAEFGQTQIIFIACVLLAGVCFCHMIGQSQFTFGCRHGDVTASLWIQHSGHVLLQRIRRSIVVGVTAVRCGVFFAVVHAVVIQISRADRDLIAGR